MKRIILVLAFVFVWAQGFSQNPTVSNIYDDIEFSIPPEYQTNGQNIYFNNGSNINIYIRERLKLKYPNNSGCDRCYTPNVMFVLFFEGANGIRHVIQQFRHEYFQQYDVQAGGIYSKYSLAPISFKQEHLALGQGKLYYGVYYDDDPTYNTIANAYILKTKVDVTFVQVPNFIGPDAICNEATYTIERAGTVTLENATGIATLTALGNNQWKVTNVSGGGAAKTIKLRSTSGGKTFDKDIIIGGGYATAIQGPSSGRGGEMFEFTMEYLGEGTIKWKSNSTFVDMSFGNTEPNLLIGTSELLNNQKNIQVLIEGIFTSSCGVVTQINKTLTLNP